MSTNSSKTCVVIPAAGRGTRLGVNVPKILTPVTESETVWSLLRKIVAPVADHVHVVVSPDGLPFFQQAAQQDLASERVTTSIQPTPIGMGDAIFRGFDTWSNFENIIIVWGDQLGLSKETLLKVLSKLKSEPAPVLCLPLTKVQTPYVQYDFTPEGKLTRIRQSREGDVCDTEGFSDVGLFGLSVSGLKKYWNDYLGKQSVGQKTGEQNFLPFLAYLSSHAHWPVATILVTDPLESRGVNTPEDLTFFRKMFSTRSFL